MVGGLGEKRVGLGLLLKTHPVRVHPRPSSSHPVCPRSSSGIRLRDARRALPVVAGPLPAQVRAGLCVCRAGRRPVRRATDVCSTGCALRLVRVAHAAAPSFRPGPRGAASLGGLSPADPSSPAPPISPGSAGPRLMPWTWSGQTPRGTGPQKYPALVRLLWSHRVGRPREVPSICGATVGGERPVGRPPQLGAALDGGSALNLGSALWPG